MIALPRSILKTHPNSSTLNEYFPSPSNALPFRFPTSPHVHFPPTPTLTDIQTTHSPFVYDRAPIVVLPNACKLPERGGRNFSAYGIMTSPPSVPSWRRRRRESNFGRDIHHQHEDEDENAPPLVYDHFSESEDSDSAHADEHDSIPSTSEHDVTAHSGVSPITPPRAFTFLPHPHDPEHQVRPLRRPKPKRKQTGPNARTPTLRAVKDTFVGGDSELSLEGCLGGF
ncbi:hypothetical protein C0989_008176 [Termitomyces sp. Mn162]|nr:hypothetical protein C0989_008176 [Termitomyces sp. Mn162]